MAVMIVRATYTDEKALSAYLVQLFGWGQCSVIWKRSRWQCTIPRELTQTEFENMHNALNFARYQSI